MKFRAKKRPYKGSRSIRIQAKTDDWETPKIKDILRLVQCYCVAEDYRYPKEDGFQGRDIFMKAVNDIGNGRSIDEVLKKYRVHNKKNADLLFDDLESLEVFRELTNDDTFQQMTLHSNVRDPPKSR